MDALAISSQSPQRHKTGEHYRTITPLHRVLVDRCIKEAGVTVEQLESDLSYRILMCAHQLREWVRSRKTPALTAEKGLF